MNASSSPVYNSVSVPVNKILGSKVEKDIPFCLGDLIIVTKGDMKGLRGHVTKITKGETETQISMRPVDPSLQKEIPELLFQPTIISKYFDAGDHVVCRKGKNKGTSGLVCKIENQGGNRVAMCLNDATLKPFSEECNNLVRSKETSEQHMPSSVGGFKVGNVVIQTGAGGDMRGMIVGIEGETTVRVLLTTGVRIGLI